jgi:hypothetical protein
MGFLAGITAFTSSYWRRCLDATAQKRPGVRPDFRREPASSSGLLATANALKHAGATRVSASVTSRGNGIVVEVSDNGIGGAQPSFGLTSVRDRVAAIGGKLTVESAAGIGTSITAEIACAS